MEAMSDAGNLTQSTINRASNALKQLNLLGKEDLSTLRSALDSANAKLQAMRDNAKSTLDTLQNELDRLQDNQAAIDRRDYENKRKELTDAIETARRMGNMEAVKSYTDALKILEQVRQEKAKQANQAKQERAQREREQRAPAQATPPPKRSVDIDINLGGKRASVQAANQQDADALIQLLAEAGLSTL